MSKLTLDTRLTPERLADYKRGAPSNEERVREALHQSGLVVTGSEQERLATAAPYRPRALHADPRTISPRWPYAVMRVRRILEGAARTSDLEAAVRGAEHAGLAKEYVETWAFYMTRAKPPPQNKTDHNPFRHLSDTDAMRKFVRIVEDICERSTAKLGRWYV